MQSAVMKVYIHAPIERVWELISNHEGYSDVFEGVTSSRLLTEGKEDRNGVGAVREVKVGRIRFVEDIVTFDPPRRLDYKVIECNLPMEHELGRIDLIERGEGTELHWVTTFRITLPLIGGAVGRLMRLITRDAFYEGLLQLKERIENSEF